jgi:SAM-dependent methyltransferase
MSALLDSAPVLTHMATPMPMTNRSQWFRDHYDQAAREIVAFFGGDAISLEGKRVGDIGCGDGIIDLGVAHLASPSQLVGFDVVPTDIELLTKVALQEGVRGGIPETVEFRSGFEDHLPCEDRYFDRLFSWSAFEHVEDPLLLAREMRRILRPDGVLMVQVWPFYHSEHGSHLWHWFPEGFAQLLRKPEELVATVKDDLGEDKVWAEYLLDVLPGLNQITLDGLQEALTGAGFVIGKVEILSNPFHVPRSLARMPLSRLGIAGVKLLAGS